ncbi:MAG: hypothetical protein ETSY1_45460 [Candidatus Entotheonella factor]|uniref:Recombinase n=1 Tax=Entotheonella factor TaxID=1429438 RepID=W4L2A6_ENTF1|nr:MAG: hypothetical protein ETSY1_45460 [Candidatus Entotheonella factor]
MGYTAQQAADATGKSKTTITRACRKGTISCGFDAHGRYDIDPAELHRVYPPVQIAPAQNDADATVCTDEIVEVYKQQNDDLRRQVAELTGLLSQAQTTIQIQTRQLAAPQKKRRSFRQWLRSWGADQTNQSEPQKAISS